MIIKHANMIESAMSEFRSAMVTEGTCVIVTGVSASCKTLASACEVRFLDGDKAEGRDGEGGQPFLAHDADR